MIDRRLSYIRKTLGQGDGPPFRPDQKIKSIMITINLCVDLIADQTFLLYGERKYVIKFITFACVFSKICGCKL